jgi:hypothetical protein
MPRRRPGDVRLPERRCSPYPPGFHSPYLPVGSAALFAAAARLDRERLWFGATALAYQRWKLEARAPGSDFESACGCSWCDSLYPYGTRGYLELALRTFPPRVAKEFRELVERLDTRYLARTWVIDPLAPSDEPWWSVRGQG